MARARVSSGAAVSTDSLSLRLEVNRAQVAQLNQASALRVSRLELGRRIGTAGPVNAAPLDSTPAPQLPITLVDAITQAANQGPSYRIAAANERVTIPMESPVESLNAAVTMEECRKSVGGLNEAITQSAASAAELTKAARLTSEQLTDRAANALEIFERVAKISTLDEAALKGLRESLEGHVQVSAGALMALERNVVQASELIVRELSAK